MTMDKDACKRLYDIADFDELKEEMEQGESGLFEVIENNDRVAVFALRCEEMKTNLKEVVIVVAEGAASFDLTKKIIPVIENFARKVGASSCRFHTSRAGLISKFAKFREIVCTWEIA